MKNENTSTQDKSPVNSSWLRVLDLGVEVVKVEAKKQSR